MRLSIHLSLLLLASLCIVPRLKAQGEEQFTSLPVDSLVKLIQRGETDPIRLQANAEFIRRMTLELNSDSSVDQPFVFAANISCVHADNWRIMTWVVPSYSGDNYRYFGLLQKLTGKKKLNSVYVLVDSSGSIRKPESEKLLPEKWFGAAYYEVITRRKSGKNYYTLLGWKGKDQRVTQKVIEVLYFDAEQPRFGAPIFKKEKVFRSRILFSFTSQASMSLRYESTKRMIVFDHLSGAKGAGTPDPSFSGPDGSYDGYKFRSGHWQWYGDLKMKQRNRHR